MDSPMGVARAGGPAHEPRDPPSADPSAVTLDSVSLPPTQPHCPVGPERFALGWRPSIPAARPRPEDA